jgi:tetratricopeptide (TPR) repeat protein
LLVAVAFLSSLARAAAQPDGAPSSTPSPSDAYVRAHRPVTTHNAEAQRAFDEGLTLLYGFNPEESRRAFRRASELDPGLAMAYWGTAMSFGVNINTPYDPAAQRRGRDAIAAAREREATASAVERALIEAADKRYTVTAKGESDRSARAFRDAMQTAADAFPGDDDVLTIAAESAMDTRPWALWTDDGRPQPGTEQIIAQLQRVLARDPQHVGANHYLIHALEASPHPADALDAARRLAGDRFEPAAEHLIHMPAHIFMRTGEYDAAARSNERAVAAFHEYFAASHEQGHESYYGHDCLFAVDAFMMAGEYAESKRAAANCQARAKLLAGYAAIRFRRWADLNPAAGVSSFTQGMAAAAAGRFDEALRVARSLEGDKADTALLGAHVVRAKVHSMRSERDGEIDELGKAVAIQDREGYGEPPDWFFPVRESLGGAYYRAGRFAEAERIFRNDLAHNPRNPRSLFGLARTLEREGRSDEVADAQRQFDIAWQRADARLTMEDL